MPDELQYDVPLDMSIFRSIFHTSICTEVWKSKLYYVCHHGSGIQYSRGVNR